MAAFDLINSHWQATSEAFTHGVGVHEPKTLVGYHAVEARFLGWPYEGTSSQVVLSSLAWCSERETTGT